MTPELLIAQDPARGVFSLGDAAAVFGAIGAFLAGCAALVRWLLSREDGRVKVQNDLEEARAIRDEDRERERDTHLVGKIEEALERSDARTGAALEKVGEEFRANRESNDRLFGRLFAVIEKSAQVHELVGMKLETFGVKLDLIGSTVGAVKERVDQHGHRIDHLEASQPSAGLITKGT